MTEPAVPLVNLNTNCIAYAGNDIRLTPTQAEIASVLSQQFNSIIRADRIVESVWGLHAGNCRVTLRVHVIRLRRHLDPLGLDIQTVWGRGYVMRRKISEPEGLAPCKHTTEVDLPDDVWQAAHKFAKEQRITIPTAIAEACRAYLLGERG